jgi:hypothetical protein
MNHASIIINGASISINHASISEPLAIMSEDQDFESVALGAFPAPYPNK